jgi:MoaA/NifB/PqqE/SkfB family radical SAM enzyme
MRINPLLDLKNLASLVKGRMPGQLVIQYTDKCNARCPQCGMNETFDYPRSKADNEQVKKTMDAAARQGVKAISFTGGEPLLFLDEIITLIKYAEQAGIQFIRTGTNGFIFMNPDDRNFQRRINLIAEKLAATKMRNFWISIDSAIPEVHEQMRGLPGVIKGLERALPIFHQYGIYPSANLGINRNIGGLWDQIIDAEYLDESQFYLYFSQGFRRFYQLVIDLGFTIVNTCYPMSIPADNQENLKAVYGAASVNNVVNFTVAEKKQLYQALLDVLPGYRSKLKIFTPGSSLSALLMDYTQRDFSYPCRGGKDFFFVETKDASVFPCGYRGEDCLGKLWEIDIAKQSPKEPCRRCDWECFRDPSELAGPVIDLVSNPARVVKKLFHNQEYFKLWLTDMQYYRACDYFDGRIPPNYTALEKFSTKRGTKDAS